jgi:hypothetical protein
MFAAGGHGIAELQLDPLVGADDEDGADGGVGGRGAFTKAFKKIMGCSPRQHRLRHDSVSPAYSEG